MAADLHVHSNFSDGTNSPEEVVALAAAAGLKTIALTDHDNVDGIEAAMDVGRRTKVEIISGIELTTEHQRAEIHLLGYFVDYNHPDLLAILEKIQEDRVKRIYKIVKRLKSLKVDIEAEEVFAIAGKKAPGRPHVARVLMRRGLVTNFKEAFNRYLDARAPAYVSHYKLAPDDAIRLMVSAGGVAVFAHPGVSRCDALIPELMAAGLRGLEVYYPGHGKEQTRHYLELAGKYGLLVTGGSDFHGAGSGREIKLGEFSIADPLVEALSNEHLRRNKS
jgi:predicted metal-dependent phosphoesterase TrpH